MLKDNRYEEKHTQQLIVSTFINNFDAVVAHVRAYTVNAENRGSVFINQFTRHNRPITYLELQLGNVLGGLLRLVGNVLPQLLDLPALLGVQRAVLGVVLVRRLQRLPVFAQMRWCTYDSESVREIAAVIVCNKYI